MHPRSRALALRRRREQPWPILATLATLALAGAMSAAHGQGNPPATTVPPAAQPTTPAEIQPGHPADGKPAAPGSGPQTAVPAPLPPGAGADTPGGSARGGVIPPPPTSGDAAINKGAPSPGAFPTPVIPPPGATGGNDRVVPK